MPVPVPLAPGPARRLGYAGSEEPEGLLGPRAPCQWIGTATATTQASLSELGFATLPCHWQCQWAPLARSYYLKNRLHWQVCQCASVPVPVCRSARLGPSDSDLRLPLAALAQPVAQPGHALQESGCTGTGTASATASASGSGPPPSMPVRALPVTGTPVQWHCLSCQCGTATGSASGSATGSESC
jgi:hypothetical protein